MSVHGEFQRILSELVAFLERTGAHGGNEWTHELRTTAALGRENVSQAADRTLALFQGGSAPTFVSPLEIEEFARHQEYLTSICQTILGR